MTFSPESLDVFSQLLAAFSVSPSDPDWDAKVAVLSVARRELLAAIAAPKEDALPQEA